MSHNVSIECVPRRFGDYRMSVTVDDKAVNFTVCDPTAGRFVELIDFILLIMSLIFKYEVVMFRPSLSCLQAKRSMIASGQ